VALTTFEQLSQELYTSSFNNRLIHPHYKNKYFPVLSFMTKQC